MCRSRLNYTSYCSSNVSRKIAVEDGKKIQTGRSREGSDIVVCVCQKIAMIYNKNKNMLI